MCFSKKQKKGDLKMKKSWIIGVIITVLVLTLGTMAFAQEKPGEGMYFRFVTHGGDDPFWAVVQQGAYDAAKELGCQVDFDLCGGDMSLQLKRFQEAVALKPDGIALVINDDVAWDKPVEDALAAGIPVVAIDNDDTEGSRGNKRLTYIGQDEKKAGYDLAVRLFQEGEKQGFDLSQAHVAMSVEVPGAMYGTVRANGVLEAMKEFGITSYEIIDAGGLEMTVVESRQISYIMSHPETTFLIGLGGITTDRLSDSLKGAGIAPGKIIAGGFDTTPGTISGLKAGYITATIDSQQYLAGFHGVLTLFHYKKYGLLPTVLTGGFLIDSPEKIQQIEELSPLHIR